MSKDRGDWIQTYSGLAFHPLDPWPNEIRVFDIAHALSMKCRYNGHCSRFYSVAEHSVLVSRQFTEPTLAFYGLLHDANEAYLPDVPRPVKPMIAGWAEVEHRVEEAIFRRFGLGAALPAEVKRVDNAILADEMFHLMADPPKDWNLPEPPLGTVEIVGLTPLQAEDAFLRRFAEIYAERH